MRGPELRLLIRSLRTKDYASIPIQKHMAALSLRKESEACTIPSKQESACGEESYGQDNSDSKSV